MRISDWSSDVCYSNLEFEERFTTLGVPYRVIGGPRFYEREEIRDAIAYLRVIVQPDDDLAFERIVNKPTRGTGTATPQTLPGLAPAEGPSLHAPAFPIVEGSEARRVGEEWVSTCKSRGLPDTSKKK